LSSYKDIIKKYAKELKGITHIPQKEIEILLLHILNKNIIWLHLNYDKNCEVEDKLKKLVEKRKTNFPLEYITKKASFYGEVFEVEQGVLIPRPETEILIDKALEILKDIDNPNVIEIGVGSGIISVMLGLLVKDISITAVDINDKALNLAKKNAIKHKVDNKIDFIKSDLFENIDNKKYDLVVSNPPYIANDYKLPNNVKYEPSNALFGGIKGDEILKDIITQTKNRGIENLVCEMGYDQLSSLKSYIQNNHNCRFLEFYKDFEDFDRGFVAKF